LEGMAEKSTSNVLSSIEASKDRSLARAIFALGILHVGEEYAELLAEHFGSIDELARASQESLLALPSIGPKIAESVVTFFRQEGNRLIIDRLRKAGVRLARENAERAGPQGLPLAGLEFVLTGQLESLTRQEAEARVKALGGKAAWDVTRKTSYLVIGADPGAKLARAQQLGVETLSEADFLRLIVQSGFPL
ncbi:MAG: NAD-dependent DNA ligase LigA, partial [Dehalococcoidia bacterium]|nr:NAD-dependent DNA ligase LigA [Dehalococcoidia bacterium]